MPIPALDQFTNSLWSTVVPIGVACAIAGTLVGLALKWLERKAVGLGQSWRAARSPNISRVYLGPSDDAPHCPKCNALMVQRTAGKGANAGSQFWGCPDFPRCKGKRAA